MTNESGEIVFDQDYLPFGGDLAVVGELEPHNDVSEGYKYTGQREETSIGLYYYGARFYDPEIGRFITEDTYVGLLTNPQSQNIYIYTLNNPMKYVDPTGHVSEEQDFDQELKMDSPEKDFSLDYQQVSLPEHYSYDYSSWRSFKYSSNNMMKGEDVKQVQIVLNHLQGANLQVDGYYGSMTKNAVAEFQKSSGLSTDGVVGFGTKVAMMEDLGVINNNWVDPLDNMQIRRNLKNHTFGLVRKNADGTDRLHQGVDLSAEIGTSIKSVKYSKVAQTLDKGDYGKQIILKYMHNKKIYFAHYAHLSKINVNKGDEVKASTIIGQTGESGNAQGMSKIDQHLHFEIRTRLWVGQGLGGRIDPMPFFNNKMEVE